MELEIGVTNSDTSLAPYIVAEAESSFSSDTSTGYLEDVIAGWSAWYKQQNLPLYSQSQDQKETHFLEDQIDLFPPSSSTRTQRLGDVPSSAAYTIPDSENFGPESQSSTPKDTHVASTQEDNSQKRKASRKTDENDASISKNHHHHLKKKRIAYPFEMVKGGRAEGGTVLEDINRQMRMRPVKAIPHPVRDGKGVTWTSDGGFGISGKAVVALARIHTQGAGSITIVRTKG